MLRPLVLDLLALQLQLAGACSDISRVIAVEAERSVSGLVGSRVPGRMRSCLVRGPETPGHAWRVLTKALAGPGSPGLPVRHFVICQTALPQASPTARQPRCP